MPTSTIGASTLGTENKTERQCIKKALVLRFNLYSPVTFNTGNGDEFIYSESYNKDMFSIPFDFILDERDLMVTMPNYWSSGAYLQSLSNIALHIRSLIVGELTNPFLNELIVRIYIFTIDNGDILSQLFSNINIDVESEIQKKFYNILQYSHPSIKDITICAIGNYDRVVTIPSELNQYKVSNPYKFPSIEDVKEAIVLCQKTYNSQTAIETSVPSIVHSSLTSVFQKKTIDLEKDAKLKKVDELFSEFGLKIADENDEVYKILCSRLKCLDNGFYSTLYMKTYVSGKKRYYYCTCGTNFNSLIDWKNNISQGLIGLSSQYTMSVQNAQLLNDVVGTNELYFIGHSLGGGLASNNAIVTGRQAITFNAAGLNPLRLAVTGKSNLLNQIKALWNWKENSASNRNIGKKLVHAFIIEDEILNKTLSHVFDESAIGTPYIIKMNSNIPSSQRHSLMKFINSDTGNKDFYELEEYFKKKSAS